MANGRKLDAWDGDAGAIPEAMDAAFATSQAKHKGERREHGRNVGENALWALMALILPAVLPGGAAYGAAGGLAGAGRALGQRAGGYQIPGSSGAMGPPRPGSVQAGASSFQPGAGGMFWGGGRGLPGRKPMVTQGQTLGGKSSRPGDVGRGRLPGTPGPQRGQSFWNTTQKPAGMSDADWAVVQQQIGEHGGVQPWMSLEHGAMGTRLGRNWSREPGALPGRSGMSIRDTPMGSPGPTGPHSSSSRHFGGNPGNPPDLRGAPGSPTGGPGGTRAYWDQPQPGRTPGGPQTLGQESIMRESMRQGAGAAGGGTGFRPSPADMAGATGKQIAGGGLPGRSGVPVTPAQKAVQEVIGRNNARTRGATREQMGLKKADPHPGHNPNAPAEANAWDHLSAKLNVPDAKAWEIVQSLDDIAMQEIMHISPTVGGNVPFWSR